MKNLEPCKVCGIDTYTVCDLYKVPAHYFSQKGGQMGQNSFVDCHYDYFFDLAYKDVELTGKKRRDNKVPTGIH
eukprot:3241482-Ditylum_brightwellii.AAC.1